MTNQEMTEFPHCPAAFINVIYEGKNFNEAIKYLQETWDELCYVRKQLEQLKKD